MEETNEEYIVIERGKPDKVYENVSELINNTGEEFHDLFNMLMIYGFHIGEFGNRLITFNKEDYIERAKNFMKNG